MSSPYLLLSTPTVITEVPCSINPPLTFTLLKVFPELKLSVGQQQRSGPGLRIRVAVTVMFTVVVMFTVMVTAS